MFRLRKARLDSHFDRKQLANLSTESSTFCLLFQDLYWKLNQGILVLNTVALIIDVITQISDVKIESKGSIESLMGTLVDRPVKYF